MALYTATVVNPDPPDTSLTPSAGVAGYVSPSVAVDEEVTNFVTVPVDMSLDVATQLDITIDGSFLLRSHMLLMKDGTADSKTVVLRWPLLWFDIYVTTIPSDDFAYLASYDARSATFGPIEHLAVLRPNDGHIGFYSPVADNWPDDEQPASVTIEPTTITITDSGVLDLFTGASGTKDIWIKPRMSTVVQSVNGAVADVPDQSVVLTSVLTGFLGTVSIDITR